MRGNGSANSAPTTSLNTWRILHDGLIHPGELHVELGEFKLAIGAQGFVAETAGDLVVAIEAGHHEDLFEQLRALRQRVELAFVHARRHEEIARAFRRGLGQDRGFDVLEAACIQIAAQCLHQRDAGALHALHLRATQVEVTIGQTRFLAGRFVHVERQRIGLVEDFDLGGHHFHLARTQLVVHRMTSTHRAADAQAIFVAHLRRHIEHLALIRLGHDLHDAFVIAQIDEADTAEVAGNIGPAAQGDGLADQGLIDETAKMGTHGKLRESRPRCCRPVGGKSQAKRVEMLSAARRAGNDCARRRIGNW